jgi:hypothetical protein
MPLYLGNKKVKINFSGNIYKLNLYYSKKIEEIIRLLSSDRYILKDSNGLYLIPKDGE